MFLRYAGCVMQIQLADSDQEIQACFPVLRQLRPQLDETSFIADVRRMQVGGYALVCLHNGGKVCAVAGYRRFEMFAFGMTMYVDDLVTDLEHRSAGYGEKLLSWLKDEAQRTGCRYLTLDSGTKRLRAHDFYRRNGLQDIALHFAVPLDGSAMWTSE